MPSRPRLTTFLALVLLTLPLVAVETPRAFPLWDGKEAVASYAARVNLPATKSIDLGGGVTLELVLIPAGQFIMGSEEPAKPSVTVADANWLIALGGGAAALLLLVLAIQCIRKRKFSFSLRFLLLLTITTGLCLGGLARRPLALKEADRYYFAMRDYHNLMYYAKPAHSETLTQPFYMGKYTVTQEQYTALVNKNPSYFTGAKLPVERVSWDDATIFCQKLTGLLNDKLFETRLPTEAQWEYACKAGTQTHYYSGDLESDLQSVAWFNLNGVLTTHPVGQKKANTFCLHDMHGNVWQWCQDYWKEAYPHLVQVDTHKGSYLEVQRVVRGGCFYSSCSDCFSANRLGSHEGPSHLTGFRVIVVDLGH